ncbi:hypothetical protein GCM10009609_18050 [Pseudonocardia aurantiaca]
MIYRIGRAGVAASLRRAAALLRPVHDASPPPYGGLIRSLCCHPAIPAPSPAGSPAASGLGSQAATAWTGWSPTPGSSRPPEPGRRRHRAGYDAWMTGQLLITLVRRASLTWEQLVTAGRVP